MSAHPEQLGRGVGRLLLQALIDACAAIAPSRNQREADHLEARLDRLPGDADCQSVFERSGYRFA
jgi:GNAT superfamily N-acetyltransferase